MRKRELIRCVQTCICGVIIALFSLVLANNKLLEFVSTERYKVSERDILNIIFMTNDYKIYPYIDRRDIRVLLFIFSFYIVGIIIANYTYLRNSGNYYSFTYSRIGSKKGVIKYMKQGTVIRMICYTLTYSSICYLGASICMLNYDKTKNVLSYPLIIETILHSLIIILALIFLQKIVFIVYVKSNSANALLCAVLVITIMLAIDLQVDKYSIILFSSHYHYIDSIAFFLVIICILDFVEKKVYIELPCEEGER